MKRLYISRIKIGEKSLIYTPGLGYTPIVVKEKAVLSPDTVNMLRDLLGVSNILKEVLIMEPDPEYVRLLSRVGFKVKK